MGLVPPTTKACPQCANNLTVPMSDGTRFCPECRLEWDPANVAAIESKVAAIAPTDTADPTGELPPEFVASLPPQPLTVDDVLGPPELVLAQRDAQAALDALIGTEVVLEGGQVATIVAFPDDDHATVNVRYENGEWHQTDVDFNDVVRSLDQPQLAGDVPTEVAEAAARVYGTIASLALRAGLATVVGEHGDYELVTPPSGWMPDDVGALAAIEQGVGYAIAHLMIALRIPRPDVEHVAGVLMEMSEPADQLKGETP